MQQYNPGRSHNVTRNLPAIHRVMLPCNRHAALLCASTKIVMPKYGGSAPRVRQPIWRGYELRRTAVMLRVPAKSRHVMALSQHDNALNSDEFCAGSRRVAHVSCKRLYGYEASAITICAHVAGGSVAVHATSTSRCYAMRRHDEEREGR